MLGTKSQPVHSPCSKLQIDPQKRNKLAGTTLVGQTEPQSSLLLSAISMGQSNSCCFNIKGCPRLSYPSFTQYTSLTPEHKGLQWTGPFCSPNTHTDCSDVPPTLPPEFRKAQHHHIATQLTEISRLKQVAACYASLIRVPTAEAEKTVPGRNCKKERPTSCPLHTYACTHKRVCMQSEQKNCQLMFSSLDLHKIFYKATRIIF